MTLSLTRIQTLLAPYLSGLAEETERVTLPGRTQPFELPESVLHRLGALLDLLVRWNARTNLTAVRDPEQIVQRHFGESLFLARYLTLHLDVKATVLDYGSGAGFPGLPIQLLNPGFQVTLAESQGKKASFLHEACRVLDLPSEVWAGRVQKLPASRCWNVVTMRAVDDWYSAVVEAQQRVAKGGLLAVLVGTATPESSDSGWSALQRFKLPESTDRWLEIWQPSVPRGTLG